MRGYDVGYARTMVTLQSANVLDIRGGGALRQHISNAMQAGGGTGTTIQALCCRAPSQPVPRSSRPLACPCSVTDMKPCTALLLTLALCALLDGGCGQDGSIGNTGVGESDGGETERDKIEEEIEKGEKYRISEACAEECNNKLKNSPTFKLAECISKCPVRRISFLRTL